MNKTDIINNCLLFFGLENINNLDENSEVARTVNAQYDFCLMELMDQQSFDFGYKIVQLAKIPLADCRQYDIRFKFSYYMPNNCMFLKYVSTESILANYVLEQNGENYPKDYFRQVNDGSGRIIILSNIAAACALYYEKQEDANIYPIDFANAFSMLLAVKVAKKLTGLTEMLNAAIQMHNYYKDIALAKSLNRQAEYKNFTPNVPKFLRDR
jgi:hypothetical protein